MNSGDRDLARVWTRARPDRSYEARAAWGRGEESRVPLSDSGDDPATETGGWKPAGKAPARLDRSYEAQAALGRGEESRAPRRPGCRDRRREAYREGPGGVQYEGRRRRRHAEGRLERAQMRTRRWKALVAWALRTCLSESETDQRWPCQLEAGGLFPYPARHELIRGDRQHTRGKTTPSWLQSGRSLQLSNT
ncbi:hypothetical protein NDU88_004872 [Pleurodeles waltl]|uniref:Uncharacterized protein n=1 Tax=Pleurodeles waltl TaxID=8319 RepID=A0AAV7W676_PLEWA|nr:hypothetical protein NDU88_004872 [Pleurodeles waltl]